MWQAIAVIWAVTFVVMLVFLNNAARLKKGAPTNWFPTQAERAFLEAQHEAQVAFDDPALGPHSHVYFWKVMKALDAWEEWQGRKLCTLKGISDDTTAVEWHAISLVNSLPSDQPTPYVH